MRKHLVYFYKCSKIKGEEMMQGESEIVRLKAQIAFEAEAGRRGMYGLASGVSRHDFITSRMERMGILHEHLGDLIGNTEATHYVLEIMSQDACPPASGTL